MEQTFTLSINIGNDAMNSTLQVADALRVIAERIELADFYPGHTKSIMDINGNRVGSWKFSADA